MQTKHAFDRLVNYRYPYWP